MLESDSLIKTNHPYIMRSQDICNGSPILEGTRIRVIDVVIEYTMLGKTPDEIVDAHPFLDLARVHDALSYYYEHREELDTEIQTRLQDINELKEKFQSKVWKTVT